MACYYKIPLYNVADCKNKSTIKNAITFLNNKYNIDHDYLEDTEQIALLETICSLTRIYFTMEEI